MKLETLKALQQVVQQRTAPQEWSRSSDGAVNTIRSSAGYGMQLVSCTYSADTEFILSADAHMEKLIDEALRLRHIVQTMGTLMDIPEARVAALMDGGGA